MNELIILLVGGSLAYYGVRLITGTMSYNRDDWKMLRLRCWS